MPSPKLPPQAYTREMLSQAYAWLQAQPDAVRKLATNSDALVALYTRYQRYGDLGIGRTEPGMTSVSNHHEVDSSSPTSIAFRNEMKSLAEDFLDSSENFGTSGTTTVEVAANQSAQALAKAQANLAAATAGASATNSISINLLNVQQSQGLLPNSSASLSTVLDSVSMSVIENVQAALNLSSDVEACRVLIKMGYEKIKPLIG